MAKGIRFTKNVLAAQETAMLHMSREVEQLRKENKKLKSENEKLLKEKNKVIEYLEKELDTIKGAQNKCREAIDSVINNVKGHKTPDNHDKENEAKHKMVLGLRHQSAKEILKFLTLFPGNVFPKVVIATVTGYHVLNDAFNLGLSELTTNSLVNYEDGYYSFKSGIDVSPLGGEGIASKNIQPFIDKLSKCEREIAGLLWALPDKKWTQEELAKKTPSGYKAFTGVFNKALAKLKTIDFLIREEKFILLNPDLRAYLELGISDR